MDVLLLISLALLVQHTVSGISDCIEPNKIKLNSNGEIEICHGNEGTSYKWYKICSDGWTRTHARLACRELDMPYTGAINTTMGHGSTSICLPIMDCSGTESTLAECSFGEPTTSGMTAGVGCKCTYGDVQLRPSTLVQDVDVNEVYFCMGGSWTRVCRSDDSRWNIHSALVTCQQLGYHEEGAFAHNPCSEEVPDVQYTNFLLCNGTESRLENCQPTSISYEDCRANSCGSERRLAFVTCLPAACELRQTRLVNGTTNREGRVEVCLDGRWGTVCNDNQEELAGVVCSQLGFPAEGAHTEKTFGPGTAHIHDCTINDDMTLNCNHTTNVNCDHSMDLGVVCQTYQEVIDQMIRPECEECAVTDEAPISGSGQGCDTTTALGGIVGVLVALLVAIVIGWIGTCFVLKRKSSSSKFHSDLNEKSDIQRQLDNPVYDMNIPVQTSPTGPADQPTHSDEGAVYSYAMVDRSRKNRHPNNDSVIVSPTSDQDYHVLDHVLEQGQGGELEYKVPNSGMPPRGLEVGEGEYSTLKH